MRPQPRRGYAPERPQRSVQKLDEVLPEPGPLRFGCVWINDHIALTNEMPHRGFKQSGYGKHLSLYALEDCTEVKPIMASLG
jgi:hypothetical protein